MSLRWTITPSADITITLLSGFGISRHVTPSFSSGTCTIASVSFSSAITTSVPHSSTSRCKVLAEIGTVVINSLFNLIHSFFISSSISHPIWGCKPTIGVFWENL